jgi:fructokinase
MSPIAVIGEALIDLVPGSSAGQFVAHRGGSPYNVAIGLARLGQPTALFARLPDNSFGRLLRDGAAAEGIDLRYAPLATEPTTLAVVSLDDQARASYDFYVNGTADWQWTTSELTTVADVADVVHFGSLASWVSPGAAVIIAAVASVRDKALVSYDPNVRASLMGAPEDARPLVEAAVAVAHVVKASREDIEWLYPSLEPAAVAARWFALGAQFVVITDGADGALAFTPAGSWAAAGRPVDVVDTVGAGDAFTAGLLAGLAGRGIQSARALAAAAADALAAAVDEAIEVSALTCQRAGADPPHLDPTHFGR